MSHPRRDLNSLAEMKGRPILISDAATTSFWPWLKAKFGFTDAQIRKYTFNLAPFPGRSPMRSRKAISPASLIPWSNRAISRPKVFLLADYGYPGYANMVLVPQKWIDNQPARGAGLLRCDARRLV